MKHSPIKKDAANPKTGVVCRRQWITETVSVKHIDQLLSKILLSYDKKRKLKSFK